MSRFGPAATAIIALAITMPSVAADEQRPTEVSGGAQSSPLPNARTQDEDFLRTAPGLLYSEIEASKLGAEKARDPQVQALSRRMAESYTRAGQNSALKTYAEGGRALLTSNLEEIEQVQARVGEQRPGR